MTEQLITDRRARRVLYKEALRRGATRLPYSPFEVYVDPCNACDLRCTFCPQSSWGERARGMMPWELYERILAELVELRPRKVNLFCYGESLLNKDLFEMIARATEAGLLVRIHTNAKTLTEEKAQKLLDAGLNEIHFSFDTADKDAYNRMRVRSDFDIVVANIRRFLALKREGGFEFPNVYMQEMVPYVKGAMPTNTQAYRDLFSGQDVNYTARFLHSFAGGSSEEEWKGVEAEGTRPCTQLYSRIVVTFDGKVHACCLDAEGYNIVGDLSKGDSLADAWNSDKMRELRRRTNEGDVAGLSPCDSCDLIRRAPIPEQKPLRKLWGKAWWKLAGVKREH